MGKRREKVGDWKKREKRRGKERLRIARTREEG